MSHAFTWLSPAYRMRVLIVLFLATAALGVLLSRQGKSLHNASAPDGIVSYEFAWTAERAQSILESWSSEYETAKRQLHIDFGFLLVYPLFLALACAMWGERFLDGYAPVGFFLSWAVLAAAPLDAAENVVLLRMLSEGASDLLAGFAGWLAAMKFLLVCSGFGYLLLQSASALASKRGCA